METCDGCGKKLGLYGHAIWRGKQVWRFCLECKKVGNDAKKRWEIVNELLVAGQLCAFLTKQGGRCLAIAASKKGRCSSHALRCSWPGCKAAAVTFCPLGGCKKPICGDERHGKGCRAHRRRLDRIDMMYPPGSVD